MGICRYGTFVTGRSTLFLNYLSFKDVAILEHGTQGHMIFNFGEYFQRNLVRRMEGVYNTSMGEMDLVLGVDDKIYEASEEAKKDGYNNLFLLPSALGDVMGIDLDFYSNDISERNDMNCFTCRIKSDADFYEGQLAFFDSLLDHIKKEPTGNKKGVSIVGDLNSFVNFKKHQSVSKFLLEYFDLETVFDSLEENKLEDINKVVDSELILVTSKSALGFAKKLNELYEIPYYYLAGVDLDSIKEDVSSLEKLLNRKSLKEVSDKYYDEVFFQFKNIIEFNREKEIVLYLSTDHLEMIDKVFKNIGVDVTLICTHKDNKYKHLSIDEFMDEYKDKKDVLVISNDLIKHYLENSIALENTGLYYHILTPIEVPFILLEGMYKLIKLISDELIKE